MSLLRAEVAAPGLLPVRRTMPRGDESELIRAPASRVESLDAMRLLAAYATVLVHASLSPQMKAVASPITRFALPFFVQAGIHFLFRGVHRGPDLTFWEHVRHRAWRLLLPFGLWNVIYALLRAAKHRLLVGDGGAGLSWSLVIAGSAPHLWFLPFLFATSLLVLAVAFAGKRWPALRTPMAIVLVLIGMAECFIPLPAVLKPAVGAWYLVERSFYMVPSICWGTAWGLLRWRRGARRLESSRRVGAASLGVAILCGLVLVAAAAEGGPFRIARHVWGIAALLVAVCPVRGMVVSRLAGLGRYSYGIFLSHVAVVQVAQTLGGRMGLGMSWRFDLMVFVLGCAGASGIAIWMRRAGAADGGRHSVLASWARAGA
jgi:peptidoglycan/LPS O-acetylase OafA/YrhL